MHLSQATKQQVHQVKPGHLAALVLRGDSLVGPVTKSGHCASETSRHEASCECSRHCAHVGRKSNKEPITSCWGRNYGRQIGRRDGRACDL
ncbi:hypothetical protein PoB_007673400 [Plakobranchus ocellatus]|uniref:Uncharacterized protein n=1 Tax=Plakobranchus ocellatus TaxID=259542 RepID=A0AAV4E153_9GAST|nr:hypothetical protein PoB_007673400 [Plakobranchus ocellatus]